MNHNNELTQVEKPQIIVYKPERTPEETRAHRIFVALAVMFSSLLAVGIIVLYVWFITGPGRCSVCNQLLKEGEKHYHCPKCEKLLEPGKACQYCFPQPDTKPVPPEPLSVPQPEVSDVPPTPISEPQKEKDKVHNHCRNCGKLLAAGEKCPDCHPCPICEKLVKKDEVHNHCRNCRKLLAAGEKCPDCHPCPICKKLVKKDEVHNHCRNCGNLLARDLTCPYCPKPIEPGKQFSLTIDSYALTAPRMEIRPKFIMYGYNGGIQSKDPFFSESVSTGGIVSSIPLKDDYIVRFAEGNSYLWFVRNLKGSKHYIVNPSTADRVSTNNILQQQAIHGNRPFWVTISPGNQIAMKYKGRKGAFYYFQLTHYRLNNPVYGYNLTFVLKENDKRQNLGTARSRTHARASTLRPIVLTNSSASRTFLDISLNSSERGSSSVTLKISGDEIARTLNQKMKENPHQEEWTIPLEYGENSVVLRYRVQRK